MHFRPASGGSLQLTLLGEDPLRLLGRPRLAVVGFEGLGCWCTDWSETM